MKRRAVSFLELKALDVEQRTIEGWASRPETDRMGDIVESEGASYRLPLPLLLDHDHRSAVGDVYEVKVSRAGIRFKAKIAKVAEPGAIKDLCDSAWSAAKAGLRRAVSIGFRSLEQVPLPTGGIHFKKWEWHELSMVSVPALASATIDQVKAYDRELIRKSGRGRVVRLDSSPRLPVVRLSEAERSKWDIGGGSIAKAVGDLASEMEEAAELAKAIKTLGYSEALAIRLVGAIARTTDAELADLRNRLAKLEDRR